MDKASKPSKTKQPKTGPIKGLTVTASRATQKDLYEGAMDTLADVLTMTNATLVECLQLVIQDLGDRLHKRGVGLDCTCKRCSPNHPRHNKPN